MSSKTSLTRQLQLFMRGDTAAADALLREVLPRLRDIATRELKRERHMAPLSRTELINELWVSHLSKGGWQIHDRGHFYALATKAMRRVLVDTARKRLAVRRGSGEAPLSLDGSEPLIGKSLQEAERIVEIGVLMDRLEAIYPDAARVVDMSYFSGFTPEEIASETGLTPKQVRLRLEKGMNWLKQMLHARRRQKSSSVWGHDL
ncbi:MAG TPA: ECF-type sigma factor [Candidatus Acidoferrales bacterium]|jgi:RNA polymerase sigma factor (TIGR02999 family)|nr:ECF-type sigma factor [Candidatus Acidoferrales bacterium]